MIAAAHSTTLLSFATILTVATAVLSVAFVAGTWVIIGRKERRTEPTRRVDNRRRDGTPGKAIGVGSSASVSSHGQELSPERTARPPLLATRLRDAMDEEPGVDGHDRLIARMVWVLLLTVAPLVIGIVIFLITR